MKKFVHSDYGASEGAALIIVLAFVVLGAVLGPVNVAAAPTPTPTGTPACYVIVSAQIFPSCPTCNPGNNYKVNDTLDPVSGTLCDLANNYGFRLHVDSVDSAGRVTAVSIMPAPPTEPWVGYQVLPSNPIGFGGSATGSGFTANCTFQPR